MKEILDLLKAGKTREEIVSMVELECAKYEKHQELLKTIENHVSMFGVTETKKIILETLDSTKFASKISANEQEIRKGNNLINESNYRANLSNKRGKALIDFLENLG